VLLKRWISKTGSRGETSNATFSLWSVLIFAEDDLMVCAILVFPPNREILIWATRPYVLSGGGFSHPNGAIDNLNHSWKRLALLPLAVATLALSFLSC
jgi:hypothetical protein